MISMRERAIAALAGFGMLDNALQLRRDVRSRRNGLWSGVRSRGIRRRTPIDVSMHRWVVVDTNRVLCRIEQHSTTGNARAENLSLVIETLRAADIEYFFVPIPDSGRYRIGIPVEHRSKVWAAFLASSLPRETLVCDARTPTRGVDPAGSLRFTAAGQRLAESDIWIVWRPVTDANGSIVLGHRFACEIEFWSDGHPVEGDPIDESVHDRSTPSPYLKGVGHNTVFPQVSRASLSDATVEVAGHTIRAPVEFARVHQANSKWFPIDVVYTWVDNADPLWIERFETARAEAGFLPGDSAASFRYANRDELRYSLRSLHQHVDFVRHIYLVTDSQVPSWLDTKVPGLTVIDHRELFDGHDRTPTFNSHAIESKLHRIPGLSERYLYVNDDVFFGCRISPSDFFHQSGLTKFFPSRAQIPAGPSEAGEPSVDSAAKNGRDLMWHEFGVLPTRKLKHTAHPQRRDVLLEIDRRFPAAVKELGSSQFRTHTDISVASSLHHHVAAALGLAVAGQIRYDYVNLSGGNLAGRLDRVRTGNLHSFCLNDVGSEPATRQATDRLVREFLDTTFPWPSPWELLSDSDSKCSSAGIRRYARTRRSPDL